MSRQTHNPGIYLLGTTSLSAIGDHCQAAKALRPLEESNMAGCNKNTPNNNNESQKMTKGTQAPPTQMRKFVWPRRAALMCAEKDNDCTFSREEAKYLKRCHLFYNQQLRGSRQIVKRLNAQSWSLQEKEIILHCKA